MQKFSFFKRKFNWQIWVLAGLMLVGVFLRTYHFHDWLFFGDDQNRDAALTSAVAKGEVAWPLTGPFMSYSGEGDHSEENSFHMGPMYYYFQILSVKIFGNYPDKMAYPDLLFSILSIPLFFFFLRIYFSQNILLSLVGIYAISAYFIQYSRFAWNTNLIPFFVLWLLLALHKFLEKNEKVTWGWVFSLGIALGIGFQLHAIVMILFSVLTFLVFLISLKRNSSVWKKWAIVLLIFLGLNVTQIVSELKTNFNNTKILLGVTATNTGVQTNVRSNKITLSKLANNADCHVEANFFLLSSYGNDSCSYSFIAAPAGGWTKHYFSDINGRIKFALLIISLLFSLSGYFLLGYYLKKEKDPAKKYFLQLVAVYLAIGFLIMLPLSKTGVNELRYFVFGFFAAFMFLGFLLKFIAQKIQSWKYLIGPAFVLVFLPIASNIWAIHVEAKPLIDNHITCDSLYETTLGELEPVVNYIVKNSAGQTRIYLKMDDSHRVMPSSLIYLLEQQGIAPIKLEAEDFSTEEHPIFYVSCKRPGALLNTQADQKIGQIHVFRLQGL